MTIKMLIFAAIKSVKYIEPGSSKMTNFTLLGIGAPCTCNLKKDHLQDLK